MSKAYFYLAGAIEAAKDSGVDWRADIAKFLKTELGANVFNPIDFDAETWPKYGFKLFDYEALKAPENHEKAVDMIRELQIRDLDAITEDTTHLLVYWTHAVQKGAGTVGEITTFSYLTKAPIYMVMGDDIDPRTLPLWIQATRPLYFEGWEAFKDYIRSGAWKDDD